MKLQSKNSFKFIERRNKNLLKTWKPGKTK